MNLLFFWEGKRPRKPAYLLQQARENRSRFLALSENLFQFFLRLGEIRLFALLVFAEFLELGLNFIGRRFRFNRRAQIFFRLRFFRAETALRTICILGIVTASVA